MTKIVYNACYGGFGLSEEAMFRYAELIGIKLYVERNSLLTTYWKVPEEERAALGILTSEQFREASMEARHNSNWAYTNNTLSDRDISRSDPILIQIVEELGERASGLCAQLEIEELPPGTLYRIDKYDGSERVVTQNGYDWSVA